MRRLTQALSHGRLLALILLAAVLAVRWADPTSVQLMRMRSFDLLQELFPRQPDEQPVAIVDIDEESLAALGQWPWSRIVVAQLVDRLTALGAAVIGFDVIFAEPDRTSPSSAAENFIGLSPEMRAAISQLPSNDDVFAAALRRSRVVLGEAATDRDSIGSALTPAWCARFRCSKRRRRDAAW